MPFLEETQDVISILGACLSIIVLKLCFWLLLVVVVLLLVVIG